MQLKRYEDALIFFGKAAEIYDKLGSPILLGEQFGNIGSVNRDMGHLKSSLMNYSKSLAIFIEQGYTLGIADQYSNIGYIYYLQDELENALRFIQKAKSLYDEMGKEKKSQLCDQNIWALEKALSSKEKTTRCCI